MRWFSLFPLDTRTGATFVHDWFALAIWMVIVGHIGFALRDPEARRGMLHGTVRARWARLTHPRWYEEQTGKPANRLRQPVDSLGS